MTEHLLSSPSAKGAFADRPDIHSLAKMERYGCVHCDCDDPSCTFGPIAMWLEAKEGKRGIFAGVVQLESGEYRKLDDPRSLYSTGHKMTWLEFLTEWHHYGATKKGGVVDSLDMRDIASDLVDFRGKKGSGKGSRNRKKGPGKGRNDFPFQEDLVFPYNNSPPPKVRAGDVVKVETSRALVLSPDFIVPANQAVKVYVISHAANSIVTGIIESNLKKYTVYFPAHHIRKLITCGENW